MSVEYAINKEFKVACLNMQLKPHLIIFIGVRPLDWKRFAIGTKQVKEGIRARYLHLSVFSIAYTIKEKETDNE